MGLNSKIRIFLKKIISLNPLIDKNIDMNCELNFIKIDEALYQRKAKKSHCLIPLDTIVSQTPYIEFENKFILIWLWLDKESKCIEEIEFYCNKEVDKQFSYLDLAISENIQLQDIDSKERSSEP